MYIVRVVWQNRQFVHIHKGGTHFTHPYKNTSIVDPILKLQCNRIPSELQVRVQSICMLVLSPPHFAVSLFLVERYDLTPETGLSVTVRVNPLCSDTVYPVLASFGTRMTNGSDDCNVQQNDTDFAELNISVTLTADTNKIPLGTDQKYCVVVSSNGEIGKWLHNCVWILF